MISMQGVPSALILRNQSWVRDQARQLVRRLPANIEKADLIQVGLIAVAQAALSFEWEGDRDTEAAEQAFVRYARQRVRGAMLDELRQMDNLSRTQRRKVKLVQVAKERWRAGHEGAASAADLSPLCGFSVDEIFQIESDANSSQSVHAPDPGDADDAAPRHEAATAQDEVEARVDTAILMRRLEAFFAKLPDRERQVIDAYLGVGLSPVALAQAMQISPSRVSQMFKSLCDRIGLHLGQTQRSTDRAHIDSRERFDQLVAEREAELARQPAAGNWGERFERLLTTLDADGTLVVDGSTRWG